MTFVAFVTCKTTSVTEVPANSLRRLSHFVHSKLTKDYTLRIKEVRRNSVVCLGPGYSVYSLTSLVGRPC